MKVLTSLRAALLAAVALQTSLLARAADGAELSALRDQVRTLEQQLKILARQIELKEDAAAAAPAPVVSASPSALTGEDSPYKEVTPSTAFSWTDGTWGALELAARYGEFKIDDDAFPVFASLATSARRAQGATLGLNWYLSRNLKAAFNFEHTRFDGGTANPVTRENENAVLTRLQVRY